MENIFGSFRKWAALGLALAVLVSSTSSPYANDDSNLSALSMEAIEQVSDPPEDAEPEKGDAGSFGKDTEENIGANMEDLHTGKNAEAPEDDAGVTFDAPLDTQPLKGFLFTVIGPDGTTVTWSEGDVGATTLYYRGEYDSQQTLVVVCREDFTLSDPEGILQEISSDSGKRVYAMTRPSWEHPCAFTAGDTTLTLFVLLPANMGRDLVVYDTALAGTPQQMPLLRDQILRPGEAIQIAIRTPMELIVDPVNLLHTDKPVEVHANSGDPYFTLVPLEPGELTVGYALGYFVKVPVGPGEPVMFMTGKKPYTEIKSGYTLKSSTVGTLWQDGRALAGVGHLVRSTNPDVIAVEVDRNNSSQYWLRPTGFGEATIYVDSDDYTGQVRLVVTEGEIPITVIHTDPYWTEFPTGTTEYGPSILPEQRFEGTWENPFVLPVLSYANIIWPTANTYLWSADYTVGRFSSSDPDIVRVETTSGLSAYLVPVNPGVCIVTYREGPFVKEVVVRSEPDSLDHTGCIQPGFYTYYGSAQVRREAISLEDGLSAVIGVAPEARVGVREVLEPACFAFSDPGVARVELFSSDLFHLIPTGEGTTTLTYTSQSSEVFRLHISVGLPEPVWEFVVADDATQLGYRPWESTQATVGEATEFELFFGRVTYSGDGGVYAIERADFPEDMAFQSQNSGTFDLLQRGTSWYVRSNPGEPGVYSLTITATPPGSATGQTWEKNLFAAQPIIVSESTVAAINEAIRTAPIGDSFETVVLLPSGYIPIDYHTPVVLGRPVTLRGQNTVLSSDVVALCQVPGAKLENLKLEFGDASFCDPASRTVYPFLFPSSGMLGQEGVPYALYGDGIVTLENCEINAGTGKNPLRYGIGVVGGRIAFRGANAIENFDSIGWVIYSEPGPRRYCRGLTFHGNRTAIKVEDNGSTDPYFIRLTESNFLGNGVNVDSPFPVNFSHNYFESGTDKENITKSPRYTQKLEIGGVGTEHPNLFIEETQLDWAELVNFEGQAPIDATNFGAADRSVQIAVKELDGAGVWISDNSETVLKWRFSPASQAQGTTLFRPDAVIDQIFNLPPGSGIQTYQGVSFAHHGPLPIEGASISVQKRVLFEDETLYLYRLADGVLTFCGEVDNRADDGFYTFFLDGCSDYIITNVSVEPAVGGNGGSGGEQASATNSNTARPGLDFSDRDTSLSGEQPSPNGVPGGSSASQMSGGPLTSSPTYNYSWISPPAALNAPPRRTTTNHYVEESVVRAAFASPRNGQVTIDVGVRTTVSGLAFELLAENPDLTLVLKGDGYEWRFPGTNQHLAWRFGTFETAVQWQEEGNNLARLDFAGQGDLPAGCMLIIEATFLPTRWAVFDPEQGQYLPCSIDTRLQGSRLTVELPGSGSYAAIL